MALVINTIEKQRAAGGHFPALVADRRLYLDATKSVVLEHGDPKAAFVLCGVGSTIPSATVRKLGLVIENGRVVQPKGEPAEKEASKPEDKQAARPDENKQVAKPARSKGPAHRGA